MQSFVSNMLANKCILLFGLLSLLLNSCQDLVEKDVSHYNVTLMAPTDNAILVSNLVAFKWEISEQVPTYRFQLATPSFESADKFVSDTLLSEGILSLSLKQGHYEWRVRAENGGSFGQYITRTLYVDSLTDLSKQSIVPIGPPGGSFFKDTNVVFSWNRIDLATNYFLHISKDSSSGDQYYANPSIASTSITLPLAEGKYYWRIRALNDISATPFSKYFFLLIDRSAPKESDPGFPLDNTTISAITVTFSWTRDANDKGSPISDSLLINTEGGVLVRALYTNQLSAKIDSLPNGNYLWKLKSFDAVGNTSGYSVVRKFTIAR